MLMMVEAGAAMALLFIAGFSNLKSLQISQHLLNCVQPKCW